jgi:hypothetical protein
LGLVLAAELLARPSGGGPLPLRLEPIGTAATNVSERQADRWADTVLARPLFSADRRPENMATGHRTAFTRLAGIIISGGSRSAIFATDGQKPAVVSEGGEIAGYRLQHISYDSVELVGSTGTLTLHPNFAGAAAPGFASRDPASPQPAGGYNNE